MLPGGDTIKCTAVHTYIKTLFLFPFQKSCVDTACPGEGLEHDGRHQAAATATTRATRSPADAARRGAEDSRAGGGGWVVGAAVHGGAAPLRRTTQAARQAVSQAASGQSTRDVRTGRTCCRAAACPSEPRSYREPTVNTVNSVLCLSGLPPWITAPLHTLGLNAAALDYRLRRQCPVPVIVK